MTKIEEVRRVLGNAAKREFGHTEQVSCDFRGDALHVETTEENSWDRTKVELRLHTNIEGDEVCSYHVSFWSGNMSAEQAGRMAFLLTGVSAIARDVETAGVKYTN